MVVFKSESRARHLITSREPLYAHHHLWVILLVGGGTGKEGKAPRRVCRITKGVRRSESGRFRYFHGNFPRTRPCPLRRLSCSHASLQDPRQIRDFSASHFCHCFSLLRRRQYSLGSLVLRGGQRGRAGVTCCVTSRLPETWPALFCGRFPQCIYSSSPGSIVSWPT